MLIANLLIQLKLSNLFLALLWASEAPIPVLTKAINLLIFVVVLFFIVRKPFSQGMQDRRDAIQTELNKARQEKAAAEEKLREIETRLNRLNDEVAEFRVNAEKEAKAEYQRLIVQANEEAERLRVTAQRDIAGAAKSAQLELKEFAAAKAVELAEGMIRKEIKPEDNARLVSDFARELEGVK